MPRRRTACSSARAKRAGSTGSPVRPERLGILAFNRGERSAEGGFQLGQEGYQAGGGCRGCRLVEPQAFHLGPEVLVMLGLEQLEVAHGEPGLGR